MFLNSLRVSTMDNSSIYRPELDVSQVLNPKEAQEYQQFVGIAR